MVPHLFWHVLRESTWSVSARSLVKGEENDDEAATAEKTQDDLADNVVCGHKISGVNRLLLVWGWFLDFDRYAP